MTISTAQYQAMRMQLRAALSGGGSYSAALSNPSDADLNSVFNQLVTDSSGVSIAANVATACASAARSRMGGALASALNPSDQDVIDFFAQLKTDSTGAAAPNAQRYAFMKDLLRAMLTNNTPGVPNPSIADMLGYISSLVGSSGDPSTIFGASLLAWYRGDVVTIGTGVSQWTDKTANGNHLIQATTGAQPAYTASDATLNNRGTLLGNGTSTFLNNVSMAIPATCFIWFVIKQVSWTSSARLLDWPGSGRLQQSSVTPSLSYSQSANTADNAGAALGSWKRGYIRLDNTTADAVVLGSNVKNGTAVGRSAASNNTTVFSAWNGGANWINAALGEVAIVNRLPTGPELTAIDSYGSSYYLASILT